MPLETRRPAAAIKDAYFRMNFPLSFSTYVNAPIDNLFQKQEAPPERG